MKNNKSNMAFRIVFNAVMLLWFAAGLVVGALAFPITTVKTEYIDRPIEVVKYVEVENAEPIAGNEPSKDEISVEKEGKAAETGNTDAFFALTDEERRVVECIVMGEAGSESYIGKVLVAQCILNACIKDELTPSEVRIEYQYAGWSDNPTEEVKQAVADVFDNGYRATDDFILWFYAPQYTYSEWHETQRYVLTEGGHRFFAAW